MNDEYNKIHGIIKENLNIKPHFIPQVCKLAIIIIAISSVIYYIIPSSLDYIILLNVISAMLIFMGIMNRISLHKAKRGVGSCKWFMGESECEFLDSISFYRWLKIKLSGFGSCEERYKIINKKTYTFEFKNDNICLDLYLSKKKIGMGCFNYMCVRGWIIYVFLDDQCSNENRHWYLEYPEDEYDNAKSIYDILLSKLKSELSRDIIFEGNNEEHGEYIHKEIKRMEEVRSESNSENDGRAVKTACKGVDIDG